MWPAQQESAFFCSLKSSSDLLAGTIAIRSTFKTLTQVYDGRILLTREWNFLIFEIFCVADKID